MLHTSEEVEMALTIKKPQSLKNRGNLCLTLEEEGEEKDLEEKRKHIL